MRRDPLFPSPAEQATVPEPVIHDQVSTTEPRAGEEGEQDYVEVTPDELVQDLAVRLSALNQDLATAVEAWKDLPAEGRKVIVDQARYVVALLPFMETLE